MTSQKRNKKEEKQTNKKLHNLKIYFLSVCLLLLWRTTAPKTDSCDYQHFFREMLLISECLLSGHTKCATGESLFLDSWDHWQQEMSCTAWVKAEIATIYK